MSLSSNNWFKYINEVRLNEGVRDIGLPEAVIDRIEQTLPDAAEKAKTWMGNHWKQQQTGEMSHSKTVLQLKVIRQLIDSGIFKGDEDVDTLEDNDSEDLKKIKYQIQNLRNTIDGHVPLGKWKKSFEKILRNLSEAGVKSEVVENIKELFDEEFRTSYELKFYRRYPQLFAMLNTDPTYYEEIKDLAVGADSTEHGTAARRPVAKANAVAIEVLGGIENPEQVLMEFPDGSYWYDLRTHSCPLEANRMGHCGSDDNASSLLSLRKHEKNKKTSSSYVTVAYQEHEATFYQIKGRGNTAPPEATWQHIADLINHLDVETVREFGEHSNDDFQPMMSFLEEETSITAEGGWEQAYDEMEETLQQIDLDLGFAEGDGIVQFYGFEMADEPTVDQDPYYYSSANINLQIDLGWSGHEFRNNEYTPTLGPDDTTQDEQYETIPADTYGNDSSQFIAESGLQDFADDAPGTDYNSNIEVEYGVQMMEGASGNVTAHMIANIRISNGPSTDTDEYRYFLEALEQFDEESNWRHRVQAIRSNLVERGYAKATAFDKALRSLIDLDAESGKDVSLKNFVTSGDGGSLDFIFRDPETNNTLIRSETIMPATLLPYIEIKSHRLPGGRSLFFDGGENAYLALTRQLFEGTESPDVRYAVDSTILNSMMKRELIYLYRQFHRSNRDPRQAELPFPSRHAWKEPSIPKDVKVELQIRPHRPAFQRADQHGAIVFNYVFRVVIDSHSSQRDIDEAVAFVTFLDENPQFVTAAAEEVINVKAGGVIHDAEQVRDLYNSPDHFRQLLEQVESRWGERADQGDNLAEAVIIMKHWFQENYGDMGPPAKFVAIHNYLEPLAQEDYLASLAITAVWPRAVNATNWHHYHEEEANLGKPVRFDLVVRALTREMGGHAPEIAQEGLDRLAKSIHSVRMEENLEERLRRIDNLLNEADPTYDLRIYKITIGCNVSDEVGGSEAETAAEIRGVAGVTTVRPVADLKKRIAAQNEYIPFEIKFELVGAASRVQYRDEVLLPAMRRIKGLNVIDWTSIHRTNVQGTVHTVRESADGMGGNFGGLGGMVGAQMGRRYPAPERVTPTPTIDELIADWAEGGVQMYDHPTDTTNMAFHVMMPVEELWSYCATYYRGDKVSFDGNYQDFIANGAQNPVYLAIGKNGRAKVTGNEDIVWFAKESGLEEVPVFISYQRQV